MEVTSSAPTIVWIYFGLVLVWFALLKVLFNRLERHHLAKYDSMGRPTLFLRNSIASGFATMKFLFLREHRHLGDQTLSRLADGMLAFFAIFLVTLVGFAALLSSVAA